MMRFFTILEGESKGTRKALATDLLIVGRSKNADFQIEDALVSRNHLEVRVEDGTVFVENKSTHGSLLNGKPLVGVVSLNTGDVIEIGHTKLGYEEAQAEAPAARKPVVSDEAAGEIDGTRIGGAEYEKLVQAENEEPHDETRVIGEGHTRMLDEKELAGLTAQDKKKGAAPSKGFPIVVFLLFAVVIGGGFLWLKYPHGASRSAANANIKYKDANYGFTLDYPIDWGKLTDKAGEISFGFGAPTDAEWVNVAAYTEKDAEFPYTGLTDGFSQYQKVLKQRHPGFELIGSKQMVINEDTVVFFGFNTSKGQGKGIYVLSEEERIVVECMSSFASYPAYRDRFNSILQSFSLPGQHYIDFPLPEEGMRQLALANPAELARQVEEHTLKGKLFLKNRKVRPDNLYNAIQELRKALQLASAPPQRVDGYRPAAEQLSEATKAFNEALGQIRFDINLAYRSGDNNSAYWAANKMMQMVPDKVDPAYQEALHYIQSLQKPPEN